MIPEDTYAVEGLPKRIRDALDEYRQLRRQPLPIQVPIRPAQPCNHRGTRKGACTLATLYRLPSGAVLLVGLRHTLVAEEVAKMRRRRQHIVAVLTEAGWLNGDGHQYIDLACAHRDMGFLNPDTARVAVLDCAAGRRRAGEPLLL